MGLHQADQGVCPEADHVARPLRAAWGGLCDLRLSFSGSQRQEQKTRLHGRASAYCGELDMPAGAAWNNWLPECMVL